MLVIRGLIFGTLQYALMHIEPYTNTSLTVQPDSLNVWSEYMPLAHIKLSWSLPTLFLIRGMGHLVYDKSTFTN